MGMLLDVTLLLAVAKEAMVLSGTLPFGLWASMALALPFFLGMAAARRDSAALGVIRNPTHALVAQGLSLVVLCLFLASLAHQNLAAAYWTLAGLGGVMYAIGRGLGLMVRGLLFLGVVLAIVIWIGAR